MSSKVKQCSACTRRSLQEHRKKTDSFPTFIKFMIGKHYSEYMYLPPDFEQTVSDLKNKKIPLEDASGQQWEVTLSKLGERFAFRQGWNKFSSDHRLQIGDTLTFHYIKGSHFTIWIYDSTGCEKLKFLKKRNHRGRAKRNGVNSTVNECPVNNKGPSEVGVEDGTDGIVMNSENGFRKSQLVAKQDCDEDPFLMVDRDLGDKKGEEVRPLFDLSCFEMLHGNSATGKSDKNTMGYDANTCPVHVSPIKTILVEKDSVGEASDVKMVDKDNDLFKVNDKVPVFNDISSSNSRISAQPESKSEEYCVTTSQKQLASFSNSTPTDRTKITKGLEESTVPATAEGPDGQLGESKTMVKGEPVKITPEFCGDMKIIEDADGKCLDLVTFDCSISCIISSDSPKFLELPTRLPTFAYKGRFKMGRIVVYLRDQSTRLWPVLYQEQDGLNQFISGWEAFSKANDVKPGDECVFQVESESDGVFGVNVIPN